MYPGSIYIYVHVPYFALYTLYLVPVSCKKKNDGYFILLPSYIIYIFDTDTQIFKMRVFKDFPLEAAPYKATILKLPNNLKL